MNSLWTPATPPAPPLKAALSNKEHEHCLDTIIQASHSIMSMTALFRDGVDHKP